jgi:hypothetical protein
MQKRMMVALLGLWATLSLAADQKPAAFYFGGKRLFVGMPKAEAVALLSTCCKLSPSTEPEHAADTNGGHFILTREESPQRMLGSIFFADGKVCASLALWRRKSSTLRVMTWWHSHEHLTGVSHPKRVTHTLLFSFLRDTSV